MSFYLQHGHGKSDKLERLLIDRSVGAGVVLSPLDERASTLKLTAEFVLDAGAEVMVDPQLYIRTMPFSARAGNHDDNGLSIAPLKVRSRPKDLRDRVKAVIQLNRSLDTTRVLAPCPKQATIDDRWGTVAWQLLEETADRAKVPVWASLCIDPAAMSSSSAVDDFLDDLTAPGSGVDGLYLIVEQGSSGSYPMALDAQRLRGIRSIASAVVDSGMGFLLGYADVQGLLCQVLGGSFGSGWTNGLRSFKSGKFDPSTRGGQPNARVFAKGLLSPILVEEAQQIAETSIGEAVLGKRLLEMLEQPVDVVAGRVQHLEALGKLSNAIGRKVDLDDRQANLARKLDGAEQFFRALTDLGLLIEPVHRGRVSAMREALGPLNARE